MNGSRPLRSTRRLANLQAGARSGLLPWYRITNRADQNLPALVSIYDEIGMYGVPAGEFLADLGGVGGDIECHINSPGGDIFDGITIFNNLKARTGSIHMVIDGLAASAASFIAQAASPGKLEMAPRSRMMIHNGFGAAFGDASDMRATADLLDELTNDIASIYAERSGRPVDFWLKQMASETWYKDAEAVEMGLADCITGQKTAKNEWDLSVFINYAQGLLDGTGDHWNTGTGKKAKKDKHRNVKDNGYVKRDGKWVFDPDNDGDDDGTAEGDTDHKYWSPDGKQLKAIPADPDGKQGKPMPPSQKAGRQQFPVLNIKVDNTAWDAGKAWSAGAASDDPAAFYRGICAGRKAGDPATQGAWALPYKYTPSSPPNAAGVQAALGRLSQTDGLTNADEAKAKLQKLMKSVNPDYDPDGSNRDVTALRASLHLDDPKVDESPWDPAVAWALGAQSPDPAWFYSQVCAGRKAGDPADQSSWALPYRYGPDKPPNAAGTRDAVARLGSAELANPDGARDTLEKAMRQVNPDGDPDDHIDPALLASVFSFGLEGSQK